MDTTGSIFAATRSRLCALTEASSATPLLAVQPHTPHVSRAEGAPVAHDQHKPIGFHASERGDDRTTRDTIFTGQLRHRG